MNTKIKQLVSEFPALGIDAFLITKDVNIRYLTDFPASESWLLICRNQAFYLTDSRYVLEAKKGLKGVVVKQHDGFGSMVRIVFELARSKNVVGLGFDERHLTHAQYKLLRKEKPRHLQLRGTTQVVEGFRAVKGPGEIRKIKKALDLHRQAHRYLKRVIRAGVTEREIFLKLEHFVRSKGAGFSFEPIVASGPNSCYPHARVTTRKVRKNDLILVDMGIDLHGYKSDLTRMFFLGKIPALIWQVNEAVKVAQKKAIESIHAGIPACEVDYQARNFLANRKLAKYFGHALGHGVGLEIHEDPRLSKDIRTPLKEGMVITVEPAVYVPGRFGIRHEQMVLVKKNGCEVISDHIDEPDYVRN